MLKKQKSGHNKIFIYKFVYYFDRHSVNSINKISDYEKTNESLFFKNKNLLKTDN